MSAPEMRKSWYAVLAGQSTEQEMLEADIEEPWTTWSIEDVELTPKLDAALQNLNCASYEVQDALEQGVKQGALSEEVLRDLQTIMYQYKGKHGGLVYALDDEEAENVLFAAYDSPEDLPFHVVPPSHNLPG